MFSNPFVIIFKVERVMKPLGFGKSSQDLDQAKATIAVSSFLTPRERSFDEGGSSVCLFFPFKLNIISILRYSKTSLEMSSRIAQHPLLNLT